MDLACLELGSRSRYCRSVHPGLQLCLSVPHDITHSPAAKKSRLQATTGPGHLASPKHWISAQTFPNFTASPLRVAFAAVPRLPKRRLFCLSFNLFKSIGSAGVAALVRLSNNSFPVRLSQGFCLLRKKGIRSCWEQHKLKQADCWFLNALGLSPSPPKIEVLHRLGHMHPTAAFDCPGEGHCKGLRSEYFGVPSAQPPTPKQTPTSVVFPSPVFETPRNNVSSFEGFATGTPRFAEEYSVFDNTPNSNLQGADTPLADISVSNPYQTPLVQKRSFFSGDIASQIATHVNHLSPNPNLPLPPVDPSRRLQSSHSLLETVSSDQDGISPLGFQDPPTKKPRQTLEEIQAQQTLTPPPTAHKGARKLAPKLQMNTLQNEDSYPPGFVLGTPQQSALPNFVTTPTDMFMYPLSAPATAPVYTDTRPFWDNDASMNGMDYSFGVGNSAMFPAQGHRPMSSYDWGRANEMFQDTGIIPQQPLQAHESNVPARRERLLAPKPPSAPPLLEAGSQDTAMLGNSFIGSWDGSFGLVNSGEGVDPGLLFSRPQSSNMAPTNANPTTQNPVPIQPMPQTTPVPIAPKPPQQTSVRRANSIKEIKPSKRAERAAASSPIKPSVRPALSRSASENKGRRAALPALAPAARPVPKQSIGSRPSSQGSRGSGRISPLKSHHRLSSLSSIPESVTPKMTRASIKFTIDSHGRARAETTMVPVSDDEDATPKAIRTTKEVRPLSSGWDTSGEDESSEDDDPIIIPSRNQSFALPDPNKPTSTHPFQSSRRSVSEQGPNSSLGIYLNEPNISVADIDSDAETEVYEPQGSRGDAASELRKVVQDRQKRISLNTNQLYAPGPRSSASTVSPTSFTEASILTPSSHANAVRCVCRRIESPHNSDGFMIQCEACEYWLHGKCTNTGSDNVPSVYICAFCGETPTAYGIPKHQAGRSNGEKPSRKSASSPLAHKSFKSFR
ncbi:hypothetical protein PFICI_02245 [Pestalotiopsis fici W106-1]|uniref:PHD-type domain-containing protein n=1 Tax=Pestalotiopsis fici (strain W106-1 / CGMCC3.15140) TaxID=1229662 RepID=W3XDW1_PESFW|nr:uncharacterized protein PFICI_02245 [Pestalotiopsis fici W106-1]ETS84220.1 hypothetical protein PFICI_02245 [Pestalotiopsis fici W106-1]